MISLCIATVSVSTGLCGPRYNGWFGIQTLPEIGPTLSRFYLMTLTELSRSMLQPERMKSRLTAQCAEA